MAGRLPKNSKLHTTSLRWLDDLLRLFSAEITTVPSKFGDKVLEVKKLLDNDCSGLVGSLLDFAINCASSVDYVIETDSKALETFFQDWLKNINSDLRTKIPTGIRALAKEYFRERWKGSSFLLLRTLWEEKNNFYLPTRLAFVDGEDILIKENGDESVIIGEEEYQLKVGELVEPKNLPATKNEIIFVQKPYESWSTSYPQPFIIKRGVYRNLKFLELLQHKGERFVAKALEYLLLFKKGTEALTLTGQPDFVYSEDDLKKIKEDFNKHIEETKSLGGIPSYVTNFDTILENLTPDYNKIINEALYSPIERKILAGLGLVEVVRGIASDRREAILNPRPFISEIKNGIKDFKTLLSDILQIIIDKNTKSHPKYTAKKLEIHNTPISVFVTDEIKTHLRSAYDRGVISKRTYTEIVGETDFDIEIDRRKKETKEGLNEILFPPVIQNREDILDPNVTLEDEIDEDKTSIEKKNFTQADEDILNRFSKEITDKYLYIKVRSAHDFVPESLEIILVSKEDGIRAIQGTIKNLEGTHIQAYLFERELWSNDEAQWFVNREANVGVYEEAPYRKNSELPPAVKKYPKEAQTAFRKAFNSALEQYKDEARAFKVAWTVLKTWVKKHKGKIEKIKEDGEIISAATATIKYNIAEKQSKLLDKLLKEENKKEDDSENL